MPRGRPPSSHRQAPARGWVVVALLAVVMAVVLIGLTGWQARAAVAARAAAAQRGQAARLVAEQRLRDWYREHLAELDNPGGQAPDPAAALAGEPLAHAVEVRLGALLTDGEVPGRQVRAWLQSDPRGAAAAWVAVDGHALERQALRRARGQLAGLARRLEAWYAARLALDPLHRLDRNWYRPADLACLALPGELPCLPDWTAAAAIAPIATALALEPGALETPWGACCPVEVSNRIDASGQAPYSLSLRIRTPWNQALRVQAVQPDGG